MHERDGTGGDGVVELLLQLVATVVVLVDFNVLYVKYTDKLLRSSGSLCNNFRPVSSYRFGSRSLQ